jgi:hypothetical protein
MMGGAVLECSFCGLMRSGGVAGGRPNHYICPDCIDLMHQMPHGPPLYDPALDTPEAREASGWRSRTGPEPE